MNLVSRLDGMTKDYGVGILTDQGTARSLQDDYFVLELDQIAVRGRQEATSIFTVLGRASQRDSEAGARLIAAHFRLAQAQSDGDLGACLAALSDCRQAWPALTGYTEKMAAILSERLGVQ